MKNIKSRIEEFKKKHPKKRANKDSSPEKKENNQPRIKRGWRRLVPFALLTVAPFMKKANAQTVKTQQKAPTETVTRTAGQSTKADTTYFYNASSMYNEIMNMAVEQVLVNPDFVEDAANDAKFIAEISKNPEIMAQLLEQSGMNTLNNFDLKGFEWTAENLKDLKNDGKMSQTLKKNMYRVDRENTSGVNCLAAVKAGLRTIGFDCPAASPYQMPAYMDKSDKFVRIDLNNNYGLLYNVDDCSIILQNRNIKDSRVKHGHSCFAWTDKNGNRVQKCGVNGPKGYPTSNRRNTNTEYDGFWCYVPSDGHATGNLMMALIKQGRCKADVKDMLVMLGEKNPQTLAVLYIENTNLKNMFGLDQIAKPSKTTKSAKAVKDQSNKQMDVDGDNDDVKEGSAPTKHLAAADKPAKAPKNKSQLIKGKDIAALIRYNTRNNRV